MRTKPHLPLPLWARFQTPLEDRLKGKLYKHHVFCSGDPRKPIGSSGCCCARMIKSESGLRP